MPATLRALKRGESKNCVETLEEMLAEARTGRIVGLAIATVNDNGTSSRKTAGDSEGVGCCHLIGAVTLLLHWMSQKTRDLGG